MSNSFNTKRDSKIYSYSQSLKFKVIRIAAKNSEYVLWSRFTGLLVRDDYRIRGYFRIWVTSEIFFKNSWREEFFSIFCVKFLVISRNAVLKRKSIFFDFLFPNILWIFYVSVFVCYLFWDGMGRELGRV